MESQANSTAEVSGSDSVKRRIPISCDACRKRCPGSQPCLNCIKLGGEHPANCAFRDVPRPNSRKRKLVNSKNASVAKSDIDLEDEEGEELRYEGDSDCEGVAIAGSSIGHNEFIGQASIATLLPDVQNNASSWIFSPPSRKPIKQLPSSYFKLPDRALANQLVELYFRYIHSIFPFLEESKIRLDLESAYTLPNHDAPVQYSILNSVFALATQFVSKTQTHSERESYEQRAVKLIQPFLLNGSHFSQVQALLLVSLQYQTTKVPSRSWIPVGHAIRVAQSLGLHLQRTGDDDERHTKDMLWSTCVILDQMTSATWGRPPMIHYYGKQCMSASLSTECFNHIFELYHVARETLQTLYPQESSEAMDDAKMASGLISLQARMQIWTRSTAPHVLLPIDWPNASTVSVHQHYVLQGLHYNYLILIHRPSIDWIRSRNLAWMTDAVSDCAVQAIIASARSCIAACLQVISLVESNLAHGLHIIGWWWYDAAFAYTSACILLALESAQTDTCCRQLGLIGAAEKEGLDRALSVLGHYRHRGKNIDVSYRALATAREHFGGGTLGDGVDLMQFLLGYELPSAAADSTTFDGTLLGACDSLFFGSSLYTV